ncbi:MAG TPA: VanW family protein, partial [Patescibacteria group bacterium]|nr:VanW family protein [Patescibacteria group bacterium]
YAAALDIIDAKYAALEKNGIVVQYKKESFASEETLDDEYPTIHITPTLVPLEASGDERAVYSVDIQKLLTTAYQVGRQGSFFDKTKQQWIAWRHGFRIEPIYQQDYQFDWDIIEKLFTDTFSTYETPAINADITLAADGTIQSVEEKSGLTFDYNEIAHQVESQIMQLDNSPISIELITDTPRVIQADIEKQIPKIETYLEKAPLQLTREEQSWEFDKKTLSSWLSFQEGTLVVVSKKLDDSLSEIKEDVEEDVQEAKWKVETNAEGLVTTISEIQPAQEGRKINMEKTAADIIHWLITKDSTSTVALVIDVAKPKFTPENINELGITHLLGTGHSSMAGSPYNRQLNIRRGVELLNGLLIAPKEEFSLLAALRPFTLENGYHSELVIAGNKTEPQIGGGLCQVGTTTFRAAMGAGLDITSRQNHSYAVSYYADDRNHQPGTDATIYDPAPDMKFINDTQNYILLQTRIEGTHLYFDVWGKSDGRKADFTPPKTYNWISPPPTKEIPTTSLAPGQRRCTESAHAGVTAEFTYSIDYADGTKHEEVFKSVYKPWQAVCQVGVAQETPVTPSDQETKTPSEQNTNSNSNKTNLNKNTHSSNANKKN